MDPEIETGRTSTPSQETDPMGEARCAPIRDEHEIYDLLKAQMSSLTDSRVREKLIVKGQSAEGTKEEAGVRLIHYEMARLLRSGELEAERTQRINPPEEYVPLITSSSECGTPYTTILAIPTHFNPKVTFSHPITETPIHHHRLTPVKAPQRPPYGTTNPTYHDYYPTTTQSISHQPPIHSSPYFTPTFHGIYPDPIHGQSSVHAPPPHPLYTTYPPISHLGSRSSHRNERYTPFIKNMIEPISERVGKAGSHLQKIRVSFSGGRGEDPDGLSTSLSEGIQ